MEAQDDRRFRWSPLVVEVRGFEPLASSVRVSGSPPLCRAAFAQVGSYRQGEVRRSDTGPPGPSLVCLPGDADADADGQPVEAPADVGWCPRECVLDGISPLVEVGPALVVDGDGGAGAD
jgi:hypothetical protein